MSMGSYLRQRLTVKHGLFLPQIEADSEAWLVLTSDRD